VVGDLTPLNRQRSHGANPCFIALDSAGTFAMVSNYTGGSVAILPVASDGRLEAATCVVAHKGSSINPGRQAEPHPHMIAPTPDGAFLLVTDLGTDEIVIYRLDTATGSIARDETTPASVRTTPGSGPRHFAFSPQGRNLYVINELDSTVTAYSYAGAQIQPVQTVSTLPAGYTGESTCAQIVVSPDGRFVYGSNRGHDSIAIFSVEEACGTLTLVGIQPTLGKEPRNFTIDPTGNWLLAANQLSGTIATFRRDVASGQLTQFGDLTEVPTPVAILFG